MSGNSSLQIVQLVDMKSTQTGWPFRFARSIVPPPTCGTDSAGARSPTWNGVEPLAEAPAEALAAALWPGTAEGVAVGSTTATDGAGVAGGAGSGANATMPPRSIPAATTPSTKPARMARTPLMRRSVPVRAVGGDFEDPLLPCRSDERRARPDPDADRARLPHGARRGPPGGRAPLVHEPGHRRPASDRRSRPRDAGPDGHRRDPDAEPPHLAATDRLLAARVCGAVDPGRPGPDARPDRGAEDRPARRPGSRRLPVLQRRHVVFRSPPRPAG